MVIIKMVRRKTTVSIDRAQMAEIMEILDCNDPHQAFGMLSLALSLLYRDCWEEQVTIEEFIERTGKQISVLIRDPPSGFREEDIGQPTPGCNCPVCEAIRARNERKANVTRH